jgi:hypothetical protein
MRIAQRFNAGVSITQTPQKVPFRDGRTALSPWSISQSDASFVPRGTRIPLGDGLPSVKTLGYFHTNRSGRRSAASLPKTSVYRSFLLLVLVLVPRPRPDWPPSTSTRTKDEEDGPAIPAEAHQPLRRAAHYCGVSHSQSRRAVRSTTRRSVASS